MKGILKKSLQQVERMKKMESKKIPVDIDYDAISSLASEARQKLKDVRPLSMGAGFTYFWRKSSGYFHFTCVYRTRKKLHAYRTNK